MAKSILSAPRFHDENAARKHLEALRWPNGPECPHCGGVERNVLLKGKAIPVRGPISAGIAVRGSSRSR